MWCVIPETARLENLIPLIGGDFTARDGTRDAGLGIRRWDSIRLKQDAVVLENSCVICEAVCNMMRFSGDDASNLKCFVFYFLITRGCQDWEI